MAEVPVVYAAQIRSALKEHFGSCGEISRVSIPRDYEGSLKGFVLFFLPLKRKNSV